MLECNLNEAVKKFVRTFRVVRRRHLDRFFHDWEKGVYQHTMKHLLGGKILHTHVDDILSLHFPGKLPSPLPTYNGTLKCLDMLSSALKSSEVVWYDVADFPLDMRFLTAADELYDVTYIDSSNWTLKYGLLPIAWKKCIPLGQEDPYNHIAVVPSLDVAQNLRDLAFSQFIVVDCNGGIEGIYDND